MNCLNKMTIETLKNLLKHYGLNPNKTFGQHFLMDETILEDMIDAAGVKAGEQVLEVGPGIGNLTERLLARGASVLVIEKDHQFLPVLKKLSKEYENLTYKLTDILRFNFSESLGGTPYKVVANIPYYITGKIVQLFMQAPQRPQSLTLLMQKEVAYNLAAEPGNLNLLAISVQLFADVKVLQTVPAHKFYPAPKVDSAIVQIIVRPKPRYKIKNETNLFCVLRACFSGKRKQLHNTLTNNLRLEKAVVAAVLAKLSIDPKIRPQQLTISQWLAVAEELGSAL
jgi:16S rRNA (adenine1518-N6/adenine1519-N6)-dimethyltransferase